MPSTPGRPDRGDVPLGTARALALQVGFYVLGAAVVVALLAVPVAQVRFQGETGLVGLICVWVALSMAWALIPPVRRFEAPGPVLERADYPELQRIIGEVAGELDMRPPDEVFLLHDANALIGSRRSWLRRIHHLGLGLPLFEAMNVGQLRSVIAHELGHQHQGDLRLGPWIYGTRQAIVRSVARMDRDGVGLHLLFDWYGRLYLRVSQAVSRCQEHHADQVAATVAGRGTTISALQRLESIAPAWAAFWFDDCVPVLERGLRPPLLAGFGAFLQEPAILRGTEHTPPEQPAEADPYHSHPSLAERCRALEASPEIPARPEDAAPALTLLSDPDSAEALLVRHLAVDNQVFPTASWEEVGEKVWLARWRGDVYPFEQTLMPLGPREVGAAMADLDEWARRLRASGPAVLSPEAQRRRAAWMLQVWLALLLHWRGWEIDTTPGRAVAFTRAGARIEPFVVLNDLREGRTTLAEWNRSCTDLGLDRAGAQEH